MPFLRPTLAGIRTLLLLTATMTIFPQPRAFRFTRHQLIAGEEQVGLIVINCRWKDEGAWPLLVTIRAYHSRGDWWAEIEGGSYRVDSSHRTTCAAASCEIQDFIPLYATPLCEVAGSTRASNRVR
jgi:hypothetical protein